MVKWTTLEPCIVLRERDSKLYTNFEFVKEKNHTFLEHIDLQSQIIYVEKKSIWILHILKDNASGVQVSDIEQVIV